MLTIALGWANKKGRARALPMNSGPASSDWRQILDDYVIRRVAAIGCLDRVDSADFILEIRDFESLFLLLC